MDKRKVTEYQLRLCKMIFSMGVSQQVYYNNPDEEIFPKVITIF